MHAPTQRLGFRACMRPPAQGLGSRACLRPPAQGLGSRVYVSTCTTHRWWVGARAVRGVAGAGIVALVRGSADDRVTAVAHAPLAGVSLAACVAVIAVRAIHLGAGTFKIRHIIRVCIREGWHTHHRGPHQGAAGEHKFRRHSN